MKTALNRLVAAMTVFLLSFSVLTYVSSNNFTANAASAQTVSIKKRPVVKSGSIKATSVKLSWTKTTGATSYRVYKSTDKKKWTLVTKTKKTSYTVNKLNGNKTYYFRVRAYSSKSKPTKTSPYSKSIAVKTKKNETVYATANVRIRKKASTSSASVTTLKKGQSIKRTGYSSNGWSKVKYNGKTYYITSDYLTTKKPAVKATVAKKPASGTAVKMTLTDGLTVVQIAEKLEESYVCKAADFIKLTNNREYVSSLGYSFISTALKHKRPFLLEGYLFPGIYNFSVDESAESVLKKLLSATSSKLTKKYSSKAKELGYSVDEIITMASVIQEEAYTKEAMSLISSVIHNRINNPDYKKLQCDVTNYYINNYVAASPYLSENAEKTYKALYDTYSINGLPEGPISCPGTGAIEAALYPEESNYYFFVTDKEQNYYFSENYTKHHKKCKELGLA
ncbi:MAG: endolytic transglycosylase MltG [Clostridia bacterium]|nr:endolytic transglycosylase MltG [Clostridia bacterium]